MAQERAVLSSRRVAFLLGTKNGQFELQPGAISCCKESVVYYVEVWVASDHVGCGTPAHGAQPRFPALFFARTGANPGAKLTWHGEALLIFLAPCEALHPPHAKRPGDPPPPSLPRSDVHSGVPRHRRDRPLHPGVRRGHLLGDRGELVCAPPPLFFRLILHVGQRCAEKNRFFYLLDIPDEHPADIGDFNSGATYN